MKQAYLDYVQILKAISDETRLKIIDMLSCGELCACEILEAFPITQPTLSYHLKILVESGLVNGRRDGTWMRYTLNKNKADELVDFLFHVTKDKEDCVCKRYKVKNTKADCGK